MKSTVRLLPAACLIFLFAACSTPRQGYNYRAHHKTSKKVWAKKGPRDLTQVKCGRW